MKTLGTFALLLSVIYCAHKVQSPYREKEIRAKLDSDSVCTMPLGIVLSPAETVVPASVQTRQRAPNTEKTTRQKLEALSRSLSEKIQDEAVLAYVERFAPTAKAEQKKYYILASISLAQGILESDAGRSVLARKANNHFGMKCFSKRCKSGHCMNRTDDSHKDFFIRYETAWLSWRAHSILLNANRYKKVRATKSYKVAAKELKAAGYATSRTYTQKIIGLIERYELHKYD